MCNNCEGAKVQSYDVEKMRARLAATIEDIGISMRKTSLDSGLSETAVHGIVKLGRDPHTQTLAKICKTLGVSMAWVMFGEELHGAGESD